MQGNKTGRTPTMSTYDKKGGEAQQETKGTKDKRTNTPKQSSEHKAKKQNKRRKHQIQNKH